MRMTKVSFDNSLYEACGKFVARCQLVLFMLTAKWDPERVTAEISASAQSRWSRTKETTDYQTRPVRAHDLLDSTGILMVNSLGKYTLKH